MRTCTGLLFGLLLAMAACSGGEQPAGKYEVAGKGDLAVGAGFVSIEFEGDHATLDFNGSKTRFPVRVEDREIFLGGGEMGELILTINDDGSIQGPWGTFEPKH